MRETEEKTSKSIKKTLSFEKSREIFSVKIILENISPTTHYDTIVPFLDTLFEQLKNEIRTL